jgi:heptosyltransferase-2
VNRILIVKTGALGDVLRTTSILPGLAARHAPASITWVTAPDAVELVAHHPDVDEVLTIDLADARAVDELALELEARGFDLAVSLDDEEPACRLATRARARSLCGAYLDALGERHYTDDAEPWFGMGLISRAGKVEADRRKVENRRTHADLLGEILGVEPARPHLPVFESTLAAAVERLESARARRGVPTIGLNTGAGGRWVTKALPVDRTLELIEQLNRYYRGDVTFVLFGGHEEEQRNAEIVKRVAAMRPAIDLVDTGTDNPLLAFAALVSGCDVLVTSDSLAMHVAIARGVPVVAFFAPTSAAEIGLFGRGEKVASTAPDYCSYRVDTDNSTITAGRLADAAVRVLAAAGVDQFPVSDSQRNE